jgi:DNA-binding response OmpR family regulator
MADKILIVDDDIDTLRLVGMMLERQGYQIIAASNGHQAITLAQSEQPDLILLDVMMPDIDGYEVTRQLRGDISTTQIPIIMFTAKSQVDDKLLGFEVGVDDYLTKPTQPRELFAHVKAVMARVNKSREVTTPREAGHSIGILSVKGGLGVTTLAVNLGVAVHDQSQQDVIVAEFRPGQGTLCLEFDLPTQEGFNRLLQGKATDINSRAVEEALVTHATGIRLLLSSPQPRDAQLLSLVRNFEIIASNLHSLARYIIFDLGTGLTPITEKVLPHCDEVIAVTEPAPHTAEQTRLLVDDLVKMGISDSRIKIVLVNRIRTGMQLSSSQVQEKIGKLLAIVFTPAPELAYQATLKGVPIIIQQPDSLTNEQFHKLANNIINRNVRPSE